MQYILPWAPFATTLHEGKFWAFLPHHYRKRTYQSIMRVGAQAIRRAMTLSDKPQVVKATNHVLTKAGEWEAVNDVVSDTGVMEKWWLSREDLEALQ